MEMKEVVVFACFLQVCSAEVFWISSKAIFITIEFVRDGSGGLLGFLRPWHSAP